MAVVLCSGCPSNFGHDFLCDQLFAARQRFSCCLFSEPALVEDLVRHFVDEPWVAHLGFSRMERINTKFHSEVLERRDGDIIMRIPFLEHSSQEIYLFLLLESQSTEDTWMALRFGS